MTLQYILYPQIDSLTATGNSPLYKLGYYQLFAADGAL